MNPNQLPVQTGRPIKNRMLLHCGAKIVSRDEVFASPTPEPTTTWFPISHQAIVEEVQGQLQSAGFQIVGETHALSHESNRYFGLMEVTSPGKNCAEVGWILGLRNSHDKSYPAGLVAGSKVFVCDNLAFTGEVRLSRKHTKYAMRDLRHLTSRAVGQLGDRFQQLDARIEAYQNHQINDQRAHDVVIRAVDCRAITPSQIPNVLEEWREPQYEPFAERSAWSLFNAFTEVHKQINPHTAVARGQALHGLFDGVVGLS